MSLFPHHHQEEEMILAATNTKDAKKIPHVLHVLHGQAIM